LFFESLLGAATRQCLRPATVFRSSGQTRSQPNGTRNSWHQDAVIGPIMGMAAGYMITAFLFDDSVSTLGTFDKSI